ncbi:HERV-H LTR-associating protein 1 [Limanda limanda]|uniref:HERV-H LTR-associating protein 1 n=1 Tax=Limanda limanda TaxID=27771 RepID=UPI0029C8B93D|nr:HERV-H LTR-associating protein 1 [Limanda limanda]
MTALEIHPDDDMEQEPEHVDLQLDHGRFTESHTVSTLLVHHLAFRHGQEVRHTRDVLDSTEVPAEHMDPAAIDLTALVNTLINSSQSGSRQLFSLLSVTSHSSLALHKLTLLVYNISSIRSLQSDVFRRRFCYCVSNDTNDLTDFTAVLLDVIGNSTSYLHELFKSASILSVSHRNNSSCIYICVMAGKTVSCPGPEAPELWDVGSISPLFNQTIIEGRLGVGNVSSFRFPVDWNQLPTNQSHMSPSGGSSVMTSRVHATDHGESPVPDHDTAVTTAKMAAAPQLTSVVQQSQTTADAPERTTVKPTHTTMKPTQTTMKPTVNTEQATTAPQPTTRSTTTTAASTTQLTTVSSEHVSSSPVVSLTRMTSSSHLRITTRPALDPLNPALDPLNPALDPLNPALDPLSPALEPLDPLSPALDPLNPALDPLSRALDPLDPLSPALDPLNPDLDPLSSALDPLSPALDPLNPALDPLNPALDPLSPALDPLSSCSSSELESDDTQQATRETRGCPWRRPEQGGGATSSSTTTVDAHKLQPCVLELCKFFSQCLCRPVGRGTRASRFCDDSFLWYETHTSEVCRRVRRISFSRNLKQRCLTKMCSKL